MLHNNTAANFDNAYQYKYNGKELQETGMYDDGSGQMHLNASYADESGNGGGSLNINTIYYGGGAASPTFRFPEGMEEYYKENYPGFYDFVKNILPNILQDTNFLKALMDVTGMSETDLKKAFTYGEGPIIHADNIYADAFYDYSGSFAKEYLNKISVDIVKVLSFYEKQIKIQIH